MAPKATTASTMPPDRPKMAMASGITAEAGSGRMNSSVGPTQARAAALLPTSAPSPMPATPASAQPASMRPTVAAVKPPSSPAARPSCRLASVASGVGKNTLLTQPAWLANHHSASRATSTASEPAISIGVSRRFMAGPRPCAARRAAAARWRPR